MPGVDDGGARQSRDDERGKSGDNQHQAAEQQKRIHDVIYTRGFGCAAVALHCQIYLRMIYLCTMISAGETDAQSLLPLPAAAFHILVALAESDRHGYAIMREVAERSGGRIKLNPGTLYTTIRRLLDQGLIVELDPARSPIVTTNGAATIG